MNAGTPPTPTLFQVRYSYQRLPQHKQDVDIAAINGYFRGKFTPNIAGSVTPNIPEIPDVNAKLSLL